MPLSLSITDARNVTTTYHKLDKMLWDRTNANITIWYHSFISQAAFENGNIHAEDNSIPQQFQVSGNEYNTMQAVLGSGSATIASSVEAQCDEALKLLPPDGTGIGFFGANWSLATII